MNISESNSVFRPPYFNGTNYADWKIKMRIFMKSLDEHVWIVTREGWEEPSNSAGIKTKYNDWSKEDKEMNSANSKALNAIFRAVSPKVFKQIRSCETAKNAWDLLENTHEGTSDEESNESDQCDNTSENEPDNDHNIGEKFTAFVSLISDFDSISINSTNTENSIDNDMPEPINVKSNNIDDNTYIAAIDNTDNDCFSENDINAAYSELYDEFIKLGKKNKVLKDENDKLAFELFMARTNFENNKMLLNDLVIENEKFKFEIEKLKVIVPPSEKCCNFHSKKGNICDKNMYKISCMHCGKFGHHNFECIHKKRYMKTESCSKKKNYFKKGRNTHNLASCHYCGKIGHFNFECKLKKNTKMTWIPKTTYHG